LPRQTVVLVLVLDLDKPRHPLALVGAICAFRAHYVGGRIGKRRSHLLDPIWRRLAIRIGEQDQVASRRFHTLVARRRRAAIRLADHARAAHFRNRGRLIRRAIVHHDHFVLISRNSLLVQRAQARAHRFRRVIGRNNDRNHCNDSLIGRAR
jgi:hypothetical protein